MSRWSTRIPVFIAYLVSVTAAAGLMYSLATCHTDDWRGRMRNVHDERSSRDHGQGGIGPVLARAGGPGSPGSAVRDSGRVSKAIATQRPYECSGEGEVEAHRVRYLRCRRQ